MTAAQRLTRLVTEAVVRAPRLWPLFRPLIRLQFDRLAPAWDERRTRSLEPYEGALGTIEAEPRQALDLGTGTGEGAFDIARRWPEVEVVGVDLAEGMLAEARRKTPPEWRERVRFDVADATRLPYPRGAFDLVALANMIPFVGELARVTAPGGHLVVSFSRGAATPIYVPPERLRPLLERHGFEYLTTVEAGEGVALIARRQDY